MITCTKVFRRKNNGAMFSGCVHNEKTNSFYTIRVRQYDFVLYEFVPWKQQNSIEFNDPSPHKVLRCVMLLPYQQTLWVTDGRELVHELSLSGNSSADEAHFGGKWIRTFGVADQKGTVDGNAMDARFNCPGEMAFDYHGNVYVCDENAIRKISKEGVVSTTYRSETSLRGGNLAYCNVHKCLYHALNGTILKIKENSATVALQFSRQTALYLAVSKFGTLFFSDHSGIFKMDPTSCLYKPILTEEKVKLKLNLSCICQLMIDSKGHLYFAGDEDIFQLCKCIPQV